MAGGAYSSARDSLKKGSSCDDRHRTDVNKDDEVEFLVRVRVERSKSPVVGVERRGGAGEPPQVASRSQLSTPFITKLEGRETEGAGDEMEPVPPSTENNGTPSYNRRTLRSCQQLPSRASKREETSIAPTHGSGVNPAESGKLGGLMDLFFPPLNPMEPNNRKLPGENDRWGFGGSSRSGAYAVGVLHLCVPVGDCVCVRLYLSAKAYLIWIRMQQRQIARQSRHQSP